LLSFTVGILTQTRTIHAFVHVLDFHKQWFLVHQLSFLIILEWKYFLLIGLHHSSRISFNWVKQLLERTWRKIRRSQLPLVVIRLWIMKLDI
jgi:hypothetical protein